MSHREEPMADAERSTSCPFCGTETEIEREVESALGGVALGELEILARNEWRSRLGAEAYGRSQSRALIRALIVYGLAPESPVREAVLRETLIWECTRLAALGVAPAVRDRELRTLGAAIRHTLRAVAGEGDAGRRLSEPIESVLARLLTAPDLTGLT